MQKKKVAAAVAVLLLAGAGAGYYWWSSGQSVNPDVLELSGNVDIRQVSLSFEESGRILTMSANEGDRVKQGEVIATLDTRTLALEAANAEAQLEVQRQALLTLQNGTRPQEIAQAKAKLAAAEAESVRSGDDLKRMKSLWEGSSGRAISATVYDQAKSADRVAKANVQDAKKALELAQVGPRQEDIDKAKAQLEAAKSQLELLRHRISLGTLTAPQDAVVRTRLLEPGDMASSSKPVYTLALTDPKWVRVYVNETDLSRVKPGMKAEVTADALNGKTIEGTVGYISSVSEFTPKTVQTSEVRTSLVYEVRVNVKDPDSLLRLGQPADVKIRTANAENSEEKTSEK